MSKVARVPRAIGWKRPNIDGLQYVKGELLHTAIWREAFHPMVSMVLNHRLLLAAAQNKTVAVISAGTSGILVEPALSVKSQGNGSLCPRQDLDI